MIIPDLLLWIVGILVLCLVIFLYLRNRGLSWTNFQFAIGLGCIAATLAYLLITAPAKQFVIVEDWGEDTPGYYRHTVIDAYGHPVIKLNSGECFPTKGLPLSIGKKYLFNCSNSGMLLYPIVYGNYSGLPSSFKKAEDYKAPEPTYVEVGCYDVIVSLPNSWFREEPPKSISTSENIFESIWHRIFGSVEIRWRIIPYKLPGEVEE